VKSKQNNFDEILDYIDDRLRPLIDSLIQESQKPKSPWLSVKEAADYLKLSESYLRHLVSGGSIVSQKIPTGGRRFHKSDLDAFIRFGKEYKKLTNPQKNHLKELNYER